MKKISIKKSKIAPRMGSSAEIYTYFVDFKGNWSYSIETTEEGFSHLTRIMVEAGYEILWNE